MIFSLRNKHICDGPCKNKPDYTGVLVPCSAIRLNLSLSAYSPQIPGLHRIQRGKHAVVRKLNCYAGVNYSERAEKCYSKKKKRRLQKCSLWRAGAELCDYNAKS